MAKKKARKLKKKASKRKVSTKVEVLPTGSKQTVKLELKDIDGWKGHVNLVVLPYMERNIVQKQYAAEVAPFTGDNAESHLPELFESGIKLTSKWIPSLSITHVESGQKFSKISELIEYADGLYLLQHFVAPCLHGPQVGNVLRPHSS